MKWKITLLVALLTVVGCVDATTKPAGAAYAWKPAQIIPNEFGLLNGTWSNVSIRQCMSMCSADNSCSGFSIEKPFGDAWQAGCTIAFREAGDRRMLD